nr:DUF2130 domain-containing protein [Bradyrhizobium sp. LVM 105]
MAPRTKIRQLVEAVIDKFNDMRGDLDKERKFMTRQWAKREMQILTTNLANAGSI